jgi:hypothetical protein
MPTVTERNVLLYSLVFAAWAVALVPRRHLFSFGKKKKKRGVIVVVSRWLQVFVSCLHAQVNVWQLARDPILPLARSTYFHSYVVPCWEELLVVVLSCRPVQIQTYKHTYIYICRLKKQNMKSCSTLSLWLTCKKKTWQGNPHLFSLFVFLPSLSLTSVALSWGPDTFGASQKRFPTDFLFSFFSPLL